MPFMSSERYRPTCRDADRLSSAAACSISWGSRKSSLRLALPPTATGRASSVLSRASREVRTLARATMGSNDSIEFREMSRDLRSVSPLTKEGMLARE
eukprot:759179-Hanusia_phi.AAC.5